MRSQVIAVVMVALLLVPSGVAWTQMAGDAGNSGVANLPKGPLDVLGTVDLSAGGIEGVVSYGPTVIDTPQGVAFFGVNQSSNECQALFIQGLQVQSTTELPGCSGRIDKGLFVVYDSANQLAIACTRVYSPNNPLVMAFDLETGDTAWEVTPNQLRQAAPAASQGPVSDTSGNVWECLSATHDEVAGALYVPAVAFGGGADGDQNRGLDHRVAAIDALTGEVRWATFLTHKDVADDQSAGLTDVEGATETSENTASPFQPTQVETVTVTPTGLLVAASVNNARAFISIDSEGVVTGVHRVTETTTTPSDTNLDDETDQSAANRWLVTSGPFAIGGLGTDAVLIDPLQDTPQLRVNPPSPQPFLANRYIGPALLQDLVLIPSRGGVVAMESTTLEYAWYRGATPNGYAESLAGLVVSSDGRIFTLETHPNLGPRVVLLDIESGRPLAEWPINITLATSSASALANTRLVATPGVGLMVVQETGINVAGSNEAAVTVTVLGVNQTASGLGIVPSTLVPPSGDPLKLSFPEDLGSIERTQVFWGDGSFDIHQEGQDLEHVYFGGGEKTIIAVGQRPDGTTISQAIPIEVDGVELSWIEEQFQPGNLDMTWGVIGILLGVIGGGITFVVGIAKRRRMKREMDRLDAIREMALKGPVRAMMELRHYRADVRQRAKQGKLEDPPLSSILQEIGKLARDVEQRITSSFGPRMSAGMRNAMAAAFADGVLSGKEVVDLRSRLGKEAKLSKQEKSELRKLLDDWV